MDKLNYKIEKNENVEKDYGIEGVVVISIFINDKSISEIFDKNYPYIISGMFQQGFSSGPNFDKIISDYPYEPLIGTCACGNNGCGSCFCTIKKDGDKIIMGEFIVKGYKIKPELEYTFDKKEFENTIKEILGIIIKEKKEYKRS